MGNGNTESVGYFEYGEIGDVKKFLVINHSLLSKLFGRETVFPHKNLVVSRITPNEVVQPSWQTAEPVLNGGFRGMLCMLLPNQEIDVDQNKYPLFESFGLQGYEAETFCREYNAYIKSKS